ncbi:Uncharacterised protein [Wolinella succinogenes]|nr:Uncharacterised protein [Wolinella succinogenes]
MVNYVHSLLWLISWPVVIYVCYKFILLNMDQTERNLRK